MSTPPVIIVGGGLAGLAAAVGLASQGIACRLLELRQQLGGRASSFVDPETEEVLDNCQHVSMGCCTNLAHFCEAIGAGDCFQRETELTFIGPTGRSTIMRASPLPAPLHLFPSLASLHWMSWGERLQLLRGLSKLLRTPTEKLRGQRLSDWLDHAGQSERVRSGFWHLVLVSALSETLDRIDAAYARKVLLDGFARNRSGWEVLIPTVSLTELYDRYAANWLTSHGVSIERSSGVESIHYEGERVTHMTTRAGESIEVQELIAAVPPYRLVPLLNPKGTEPASAINFRSNLESMETAPIASVHLWFDRPLTELRHAVLVDRLGQWMFNRSLDSQVANLPPQPLSQEERRGRGNSWYCQVVISASRDVEALGNEATINTVADELRAIWPDAHDAKLLRGRVVVERRAVFSVTPGIDAIRPAQQSPIPNLQLAGDWTQTGWPATMEGAVRSGYLAAENVLQRLGNSRPLIQPDLPVPWLSKMVFG
jgi:squalene-associated FAD-dependent desaturase